ncbi:MAG: hypothetical protein N2440_01125, partial [Actinobacteria bacterium]|nr:hypothetical protein [Actinomycetota bacterium]
MIDRYLEDLKDNLKSCLSKFSSHNRKVEVELSAWYQESQSYRLARNEVIQPQTEKSVRISARVISEKKTGIAVTNSILTEDILSAIETAYDLSKSQKPRVEAGLPEKPHKHFSQIEAEGPLFNIAKNFERINDWLLFAKEARVFLSGKFQISRQALIVVNTKDTETVHIFPLIKIEFIAERDEISGFGSYISHQFEPFIIMNELERAVSKASHYGKVV